MKIDYDKYAGYEFCPKLKNITNEVFCKMPQLTFRARKIDQNKSAIIGVDVFEKMHNVGSLFILHENFRGENQDVIYVESHLIKKSRGATDQVKTTNTKRAISKCLEVFKPKESKEIARKLYSQIKENMSGVVWKFDRHLPSISSFESSMFLLPIAMGESITVLPKRLNDELLSNKENIDNARIARSVAKAFEDMFGAVVRLEYDGSLSFLELTDETQVKNLASTYDLPVNYQEKLAILKIMENEQPIQNIGCKFEVKHENIKTSVFFLVGGDTIPQ